MGKIIVRSILLILAISAFLCFLLPLLFFGILNIGNLTGICLTLLLILFIVFYRPALYMLKKFCRRPRNRFLILLVLTAAGIVFLTAIFETGLMIHSASKEAPASATAVVLGCKVNGTQPSLMLKERLDTAAAYLEANPDADCIVTGGQGSDEAVSEAECMYQYLLKKGISADRIYKEDQAVSTRENLLFSKQLIEEQNLNPDIAIITNEFHQYRAGKIARNLDLTYGAVSAPTLIVLFPTYYIRELYGILYEWIL